MLLILVKNNFKLMLRDKMSMLFLIFLPILLIAILSSAFSQMLNKDYTLKSFTVGYNIEAGSHIDKSFSNFIKAFEENKITLTKMTKEKAVEEIKNGSLAAYVDINDNEYTIYKKDAFNINAEIFENSMNSAMYLYDGNKALVNYLVENKIPIKTESGSTSENKNFVKLDTLKVDPMPSSIVYYGITEIVYVIWFGMLSVSLIVNNERKYGVTDRIGLTNASPLTLFFGKLIPSVLVVSIQICIATIASIILMDVNWGNSPLLSAGILFLEIITSSVLGILISLIIKSQALSNVIIVLFAFFFGFVGGSFQTYMYNFVSDNLAKLSPLYYINRTLVEISIKGYSDYTNICIILLLTISIIAIIIGVVTTAKGREVL
ncbi:ABC transporter permease [Clostridium pasteurianum]|uniref:ABC-type multidrug transport system, permease component n=1 Tax=Clostridium pasteurianum BC1 TaxID=86416 RepID=R4K6C3_CLOPA|nr:ABC transporter permease [Clostridium pasteurianum]AGK98093.1 ABC-type multidrug transport system, permease component [Clostridium pasteurianum BC1]